MALWGKRSAARLGLALALLVGLCAGVLKLTAAAKLEPADCVVNNGVEVTSLDPAIITGQPEGRLAYALFEGLVSRHPQSLAIVPAAAESWSISADGLQYEFQLRHTSRWSNGDPVCAQDFCASFARLLDPRTAAPYAQALYCVRGAKEYATTLDSRGAPRLPLESVGLRAPDEHTLQLELAHPTPYLLDLLSFHAFLPVHARSLAAARERFGERWSLEWLKPENLVSNGPYRVLSRRINDRIRLVKHTGYWDHERVAMRTIDVLAIEHMPTILNMFLSREVHYADRFPLSAVGDLLGREDYQKAPFLATYFYRINVTRPPLNDRRVRQALALSLNRRAVCERVLQAGQAPAYSLVPPGIPGYTPAQCPPEDKARALERMQAAGFGPAGRPFPAFNILYNTSEAHHDVALVVAHGWRLELGLEAGLENQEWKVYLDTQAALDYDLARASWIGDFLDPLTFLEIFGSDNPNNKTGWSHARYDELLQLARLCAEPGRRLQLLHEAESILMEELPILPLYTYVSQNLVAPRLGGFYANLLDYHPPKYWYWKDEAELDTARRSLEPNVRVVQSAGPAHGLYAPAVNRERGKP